MRTVEFHWPIERRSAAHALHGYWWNFIRDLTGFHPEKAQRDYLQTFFLGYLEIAAYAVLISQSHLEGIGFWIAAKTVPHWKQWQSRESYIRFFLGNAFVVVFAYLVFVFLFHAAPFAKWVGLT